MINGGEPQAGSAEAKSRATLVHLIRSKARPCYRNLIGYGRGRCVVGEITCRARARRSRFWRGGDLTHQPLHSRPPVISHVVRNVVKPHYILVGPQL